MRLGFDAKRAMNNFTGLGNHARILLNAMMRDFKDNTYVLFSPKAKTGLFNELDGDFELVLPQSKSQRSVHPFSWFWAFAGIVQPYTFLKKVGLWRSWGITTDLEKQRINIYHGLSNELPFNIHRTGIKTVVTIHDLIFLKHTAQYPFFDRQIYKLKTRYAVKHANKIIAVSNETKNDLIHYYQVPAEKIAVIYPSVDIAFQKEIPAIDLSTYALPAKFILNVGSFYPRKNQQTLIEAFDLIKDKVSEDLVLLGSDGTAKKEIENLIASKSLGSRIKIVTGVTNADLPAIYKKASLFVFPSLFEGFGAPVLEALFCKVPVIATKGGAIEEAAGPNSLFIDAANARQMADTMLQVLTNETLKNKMIEAGYQHAQTMTDKVFAQKTMAVYKEVMQH